MKYWYDTEFIEDGKTIDLISIGIVAEDDREYYAICQEFDQEALSKNVWLVENVLPSLPHFRPSLAIAPGMLSIDIDHPDYRAIKPRSRIAEEVREFIRDEDDWIQLWTYYGAYDHVALMQLFGSMIARPSHFPMYSHDLMQAAKGNAEVLLTEQKGTAHNALDDARWTHEVWEALNARLTQAATS